VSFPHPVARRTYLMWLAGAAVTARAGNDFCDPALPRVDDDPQGYRMRGSRCEGIYVRLVAGDELRLASLTRWVADVDPAHVGTLPLRWSPAPGDGNLRLRAQGLARRNHYRMDSTRSMRSGVYEWPMDLLAARGLRPADLGLVGSTRLRIDDAVRELLVPLEAGQRAAGPPPRRYTLLVVPQIELSRLGVRIQRIGAAAQAPAGADAGSGGYYPAERAVELALAPDDAGIWRADLTAVFRQGGSSATGFWFHHPGW